MKSMVKLKRRKITERSSTGPYKRQSCNEETIVKNPFKSARKIQNLLELKENNTFLNKLPAVTLSQEKEYTLPELHIKAARKEGEETKCRHLPNDWSLKSHYKLLSRHPFKSALKASDEAQATAALLTGGTTESSGPAVKLRYHTSYWIHPNLPWLQLFPRDSAPSVRDKSENTVLKSDATTALLSDWEAAFESVFGLLKSGNCQYFYLCSHHTTVLFRQGPDGTLSADMVPTTYGVRSILKQEDIEFTLPLAQDIPTEDPTSIEPSADAKEFLESIGVDSNQYTNLDPAVVKLKEAGRLNLDHSVRSAVRVRGSHVQGLFNYLLNNKSLIPSVGELAGVPPTLLSPSTFAGATLRSCKVKCGSSRVRKEMGEMEDVHYVHISGPLLPSATSSIAQLFVQTQGEFKATLSSVQYTSAFNAPHNHTIQDIVHSQDLFTYK